MLLANETIAEHFYWLELPFLYRVHENPKPEKLLQFANVAKTLGYTIKGSLENVSGIVKSITEGDTTVSYSESGTPESQLLECISRMSLDISGLVRFRKMVW